MARLRVCLWCLILVVAGCVSTKMKTTVQEKPETPYGDLLLVLPASEKCSKDLIAEIEKAVTKAFEGENDRLSFSSLTTLMPEWRTLSQEAIDSIIVANQSDYDALLVIKPTDLKGKTTVYPKQKTNLWTRDMPVGQRRGDNLFRSDWGGHAFHRDHIFSCTASLFDMKSGELSWEATSETRSVDVKASISSFAGRLYRELTRNSVIVANKE